MKKKLFAITLAIFLLIGCIAVGSAATDAVTTFDALQAAVSDAGDATIKLSADIGGSTTLTIDKDVTLDLNGYDITCPIEVADDATLYCMDSQTDDYTVNDAYGYGKLTNVTGTVKGVPANAACANKLSYLKIAEDGVLSFHALNLEIHAMSMRSNVVGVYYLCDFAGDEKVAENVKQYGIAFSVQDIPNAANLDTLCQRSRFSTFKAGKNAENAKTGTLLKNIMNAENSYLRNIRNATMPVYGRAYICTKNNEYIFGNVKERSLQNQVELACNDQYWNRLKSTQVEEIVNLYGSYYNIMKSWDVSKLATALCRGKNEPISEAVEGKTLKLLALTSSFGKNTTELLYDVAIAQGYENVTIARLYSSGCTLKTHVDMMNTPDQKWYQYTRISNVPGDLGYTEGLGNAQKWVEISKSAHPDDGGSEETATALSTLMAEQWDIILLQQGAANAGRADTYNDYIRQALDYLQDESRGNQKNAKLVWNMLWAYDWDYTQKNPSSTVFSNYFKNNQLYMYECNVNAVLKKVLPYSEFDRIIPSGTVIQNARTYYDQTAASGTVGETLCKDGYHLRNKGGVLAAYGMWTTLTGQEWDKNNMSYPEGYESWSDYWYEATGRNGISGGFGSVRLTEADQNVFIESLNNAFNNPFSVTETQYTYGN